MILISNSMCYIQLLGHLPKIISHRLNWAITVNSLVSHAPDLTNIYSISFSLGKTNLKTLYF